MIIESLELKDFRNYEYLNLGLDENINIFYGNNAQGKTNVLESIYLASTARSQLQSKDKDMIRFDCDDAHIKMIVNKCGNRFRVDVHLKRNKNKGIALNGIPFKKLKEYVGTVNVISFSPDDLNIIKNGPSERRRFIDSELCQISKPYLYYLTKYNKILGQRNALLKELSYKRNDYDTLDVWDYNLAQCAGEVIRLRLEYIESIEKIIGDIHRNLTDLPEELVIKYEPDVIDSDVFLDKLRRNRENDIKLKTTSVGPQRDDVSFFLDGIDLRKYGSQGQKRTVALALKLAEIQIVKENIGDMPILLLDDVMSELDNSRQELLLENLKGIQTIITCTGIDDFIGRRVEINKVFEVKQGRIITKEDNDGKA